MTDAEILPVTGMSPEHPARFRQRCCEVGPVGALERKALDKREIESHETNWIAGGRPGQRVKSVDP